MRGGLLRLAVALEEGHLLLVGVVECDQLTVRLLRLVFLDEPVRKESCLQMLGTSSCLLGDRPHQLFYAQDLTRIALRTLLSRSRFGFGLVKRQIGIQFLTLSLHSIVGWTRFGRQM